MATEKSIVWRDQAAYLNDTMYVGRINQGSCEITRKTVSLGGIGGVGNVDVPTGKLEPIKASVVFNSLSVGDVRTMSKNDGYIELRLTGTARVLDTSTGTRVVSNATTRIKGWALNLPNPAYGDDPQPYNVSISVLFIEVSDSQGTALLIDMANGIMEPNDNSGSLGATVTL